MCVRHGYKIKLCSSDGCTNIVVKGGVCVKHGAKVKQCNSEGCTNNAKKGGVCMRHGAYRNTQDGSTAFGSKFDDTTANLSQPNHLASRTTIRYQGGRSVPAEVAILCQEVVEV